MVQFILFLRRFARFLEGRADASRDSALRKVSVQKRAERKAAEARDRAEAQAWEREVKRHNDSLTRIRNNVHSNNLKARETQEALDTKVKRLELL